MNAREFGNFSAWPLKELIEKERSFTVGDLRGVELKGRNRSKARTTQSTATSDQHYSRCRVSYWINDSRGCQLDRTLFHLAALKVTGRQLCEPSRQ